VRNMAYAVGQTVEVCLEFDPPPARGVRRVVAFFVNEHGDVAEFTDVPVEASDYVLQEPTQIGLRGRATRPASTDSSACGWSTSRALPTWTRPGPASR